MSISRDGIRREMRPMRGLLKSVLGCLAACAVLGCGTEHANFFPEEVDRLGGAGGAGASVPRGGGGESGAVGSVGNATGGAGGGFAPVDVAGAGGGGVTTPGG